MFKLIKIINSGVNVPEFTKLEKPSSLTVKMGTALVVNGGLAEVCPDGTTPTHIVAEAPKENAEEVVCYEVNGNMRFETTVNSVPTELKVGNRVSLGFDSDGCAVCVGAYNASGVATIVDLLGAKNVGDKVTVKF